MMKPWEDILSCPRCRERLIYQNNLIYCPLCKKSPRVEGRLFDFSTMAPELPLDFQKYTQWLHEYLGGVVEDIPSDFRTKSVIEMMKQEAKGKVCLEIGGGDGVMSVDLEKRFDTVLTIDFSKTFLKRIESKTSKTLCLYQDSHFLPIQNESIDTVICCDVLEHVAIPTQFLSEINRVMNKEGVCILNIPNEAKTSLRRKKREFYFADDTHINFFNSNTLTKLLFRMGFKIVELKKLRLPLLSLKSLRWFVTRPLSFIINQIFGLEILCLIKVLDNPRIYWETFEERAKKSA